jgi:hypothetical protein
VALALLVAPAAALAGLPGVASGPRPGPDALYDPPPVEVPQLENAGPWEAPPILVSGASAYRRGEFLYQDFLHDDRGGMGAHDPNDPFTSGDFTFSPHAGTLTYPTDRVFANNGADLVELRVKPLAGATALRVTLNALQAPERTAFTVAIGTSPAARAWPAGAGVSSPAQLFLTVHGSTAELRDAATGALVTPAPTATVDTRTRQFDVRIAHAAWDPGAQKVRLAAGVGLWDTAANRYMAPGPGASATAPGGASPSGAALFNLAFRFDEPKPDVNMAGGGATIGDAAAGAAVQAAWWRERAQADALRIGDASPFHAEVDFGKLAPLVRSITVSRRVRPCRHCGLNSGRLALPRRPGRRTLAATVTWHGQTLGSATGDDVAFVRIRRPTRRAFRVSIALRVALTPPDDDAGVPRTGPIDRIFASRSAFGQGVDYKQLCGGLVAAASGAGCNGAFIGQLQTYALYVPRKPAPPGGYGITLLLHSLSANHNQYLDSNNQSQFGERAGGSLVATPAGRGPDGSYRDIAEADTFEVWADVARHYRVDSDWAAVTGYSMGGLGTFRLLSRWPDLFARGMSVVGAGSPDTSLPSLRNTPVMSWAAGGDELVNLQRTEATTARLGELGLRFDHWLFPASDHLTLATNDEYGPAAAFLGSHRVDRDPPHVTFVVDPTTDSPRSAAVADHAFWLSGLRVRDASARRGTIDVRSEAFGVGDPKPTGVRTSGGTLNGGAHGPMAYERRDQDWGAAPPAAKADRLVVRATNISRAFVDARRAKVSCAPRLDLVSDGPIDLRIACPAPVTRHCAARIRIPLPRLRGRRIAAVVVYRGGRVVHRASGRNLRTVSFARPSLHAFTLRVVAYAAGTPVRAVTIVRRYRACPV